MKHCHISIMCNEISFLKQKLNFLYNNFDQLIFVDYNIVKKCNSTDGSIEFIENFNDINNKIKLIKNFDPSKIKIFRGESFIDKQKMFAEASKYVNDDIDIVWATDLDEFFHKELIKKVEDIYINDETIISIDIPHRIFAYNQYNVFDKNNFYICPRITRHKKNFIYGHCDFQKYGKTIKLPNECYYHFAFVGYNRCKMKYNLYTNRLFNHNKWLEIYLDNLKNNKKYVSLPHSNLQLKLFTTRYEGEYPDYMNVDSMVKELNFIS